MKMARPKKDPKDKKDRRLTHYMTEGQETRLDLVASFLKEDKTEFVQKAIDERINRLDDPPLALIQAKHEQIMNEKQEQVSGFVCARGHAFWIEWVWPSPPRNCPCCGDRSIKSIWSGIVKKGF